MLKRNQLLLLLAGVLVELGCDGQPGSRDDSGVKAGSERASALPACPRAAVSMAGWVQAATRDGRLTFRLPPRHSSSPPGTSEIWFLPNGSVAYRVDESDQRWRDSVSTDPASRQRGWCEEEIDGIRTLVQYTYASAATGAGYYLQAVWYVEPQRELRLIGFMSDTSQAGQLLEIVRSARLRATTSAH